MTGFAKRGTSRAGPKFLRAGPGPTPSLVYLDALQGLPVVLPPERGDPGEEQVRDDAAGPHVRAEPGALHVDDLGSHELGLAVVELHVANHPAAQGEVGDLIKKRTKRFTASKTFLKL